jgi:hypothetical protein
MIGDAKYPFGLVILICKFSPFLLYHYVDISLCYPILPAMYSSAWTAWALRYGCVQLLMQLAVFQ